MKTELTILLVMVFSITVLLIIVHVLKPREKYASSGPNSDAKNKGDTLHVEEFLLPGDYLQSKADPLNDYTPYTARLGGTNNRLVLSNGLHVAGFEHDSSLVGEKLLMQPDGNLVILDKNGKACWSVVDYAPNTISQNDRNTRAVLQFTDGNLAVYNSGDRQTWNSDPKNKGDTLYAGEFLLPGDYLQSKNNSFYTVTLGGPNNRLILSGMRYLPRYELDPSAVGEKLLMQPDGNLVILDKNGKACWSAVNYDPNDYYSSPYKAVLQGGNLVVYDSRGDSVWDYQQSFSWYWDSLYPS